MARRTTSEQASPSQERPSRRVRGALLDRLRSTCRTALRRVAPRERPRSSGAQAEVEAVLESVRDPLWWVDRNGRLLLSNASFQELWRSAFGRGPGIGESPSEVLRARSPEVAAHWDQLYARALAGEVIHERQQLELAGERRTYWVSLYPVQRAGDQRGVCCCTKDITELERTRDELRQANERYQQLFDTCPLPVLVTRMEDGMLLAANRAAEAFYGVPREQGLGRTTVELGLWANPEDRKRLLTQLQAQGSVSRFETRHRRAGGEVRDTVLSCTTALLDGVRCIIALSEDVTERKRFAHDLEQSEERYRRLFDACPLPIFVTRLRDGRVLDLNPSAELGSGWKRDEVLGRTALELGWWGGEGDRQRLLGQVTKEGMVRDFAWRIRTRDGEPLDVLLSAAVVRLGEEACLVTLVEDVTERKRLEEQLRQGAKMEAVGRLAGGIAHDFNNLLTVIVGQTHLLRRHLGDENPELPLVGRIEEAVQRATRLTGQLLTFGRKQVLQPQPHDVSAIVRECSSMIEHIVGEEVELTMVLSPDATWSVVDRGQLEQVVMNLALNARDAMPGGGRLVVHTDVVDVRPNESGRSALPPGPYVLLAVSDTGSGMDERTRSRVFEPFFTTKPQGKGIGLGLPMVYGMVRERGGFVLVDSAPGKGSTFQIYLPRVEPPARREPRPPAPEPRPTGARRCTTVLLVEDEDDVRLILEEMLKDHGHGVLSARNGEEALALARREREAVDVLVTDLMMPRMNGAELARRLRAERPDLRVIFISGYAGEAAAQLPPLDERTAFLQKPFPEEALERRLSGLIEATGHA